MNFETVVTAVLSSSLAGLVVGYILNRRLEAARLRLEEAIRRGGALHDKQAEVFCELLEMTYRIRNAAREFSSAESHDKPPRLSAATIRRFDEFHRKLIELLYKKRGVIPPELFRLAHDLKLPTNALIYTLDDRREGRARSSSHVDLEDDQRISELFRKIDTIYEAMVPLVHAHIGIQGSGA